MDGGGTTTGTWEVESCRERRPRAASGDPQGCGEVEQRMEQLPEQRPRSPKRPGAGTYTTPRMEEVGRSKMPEPRSRLGVM
jgi:hypothetical protein